MRVSGRDLLSQVNVVINVPYYTAAMQSLISQDLGREHDGFLCCATNSRDHPFVRICIAFNLAPY